MPRTQSSSSDSPRTRFDGLTSHTRSLLRHGETAGIEFKQTSQAVKADVLAAAANWTAQHPEAGPVVLLVGVEESEDSTTGIKKGIVVGLASPLHEHVDRIRRVIATTMPVPVHVEIYEENVATSKPILRLLVSATRAPHYDSVGKRATREGASTRPLTDEECLDLYVDREGRRFEQQFEFAAAAVSDRVEDLVANVEDEIQRLSMDLADRVQSLLEVIGDVAHVTEESAFASEQALMEVQERIGEVGFTPPVDYVEYLAALTPHGAAVEVRRVREQVWQCASLDLSRFDSQSADRLVRRLRRLLSMRIDVDDWAANFQELRFWASRLPYRHRTASWWTDTARLVEALAKDEVLEPSLPDLIGDLRRDLDDLRTGVKRSDSDGTARRRSKA